MKKLNLNAIRIDGGTQSRVEINLDAVSDYADAIRSGAEMPAVVVFHDGAEYWLADGFHRYHAHKAAEKASILADVQSGTQRDAILYSLGANRTHGLRRTNADKRKSVAAMVADTEWSQWSDRKIADVCGVGHPMVAAMRRPEIAKKQEENRVASAAKKVVEVESDSTRKPEKVESDSTPAPKTGALQVEQKPEAAPTDADELAELHHTITDLAAENERLSDRLAVEAMDASEEEKTAASQTIAALREQVSTMEAELSAVKASRDTYMRENAELKKQVNYWRKQAEKAAA